MLIWLSSVNLIVYCLLKLYKINVLFLSTYQLYIVTGVIEERSVVLQHTTLLMIPVSVRSKSRFKTWAPQVLLSSIFVFFPLRKHSVLLSQEILTIFGIKLQLRLLMEKCVGAFPLTFTLWTHSHTHKHN